jgi:hypothetical protein
MLDAKRAADFPSDIYRAVGNLQKTLAYLHTYASILVEFDRVTGNDTAIAAFKLHKT